MVLAVSLASAAGSPRWCGGSLAKKARGEWKNGRRRGRRAFYLEVACGFARFRRPARSAAGVQSFEVAGQAHEVPFAADFPEAAQQKLPEPERAFDDAEDGFDGAGASPVAGFAFGGPQLFGHGDEHGVGGGFGRFDFVEGAPVVAPLGVGVFAVDADVQDEPGVVAAEAFEGGFVGVAAVGQGGGGCAEARGGMAARSASVSPTSAAQVLTRWPRMSWLPSASTMAWAL